LPDAASLDSFPPFLPTSLHSGQGGTEKLVFEAVTFTRPPTLSNNGGLDNNPAQTHGLGSKNDPPTPPPPPNTKTPKPLHPNRLDFLFHPPGSFNIPSPKKTTGSPFLTYLLPVRPRLELDLGLLPFSLLFPLTISS